jgi:hypothetical protein
VPGGEFWGLHFVVLVLLGAFRKIEKNDSFYFIMSVCPSVRVEQLGSHCTDFHEIYILCFSQISRENSSVIKTRQ